jgi:hypothetical protein
MERVCAPTKNTHKKMFLYQSSLFQEHVQPNENIIAAKKKHK